MSIKKFIPKSIYKKLYDHFRRIIISELKSTKCTYELNIIDKGKLEGKTALVTGGSGAIGSAISFRLAMEGARVIVCGRNEEKIKEVVGQIRKNNGKAEGCILDVNKQEEIEKKISEIANKYKRIDILVNNAGGSSRGEFKKLYLQSTEIIKNIIDTNLMGTIFCSRQVAKSMIKNHNGKIINIGSTVGVNGLSGFSEYAAAKAGVIGLTKSLAMELAEFGINVNCVSPGKTSQILWDKELPNEKTDQAYIPRLAKTDDIANVVAFLSSNESDYITGQNIIVDGGRSLGLKNS